MLDARHPNSNTEKSCESCTLKTLARTNEKYKSVIDLLYAYALATLDDETIEVTGFSYCGKL